MDMNVRAAALAVVVGAFAGPSLSVAEPVAPAQPIAEPARVPKLAKLGAEWRCAPDGHETDELTIGSYLVIRSDAPLTGYTLLLNGQPLTRAHHYECGDPGEKAHLSGYWLRFGDADQSAWEAAFSAHDRLVIGLRSADGKSTVSAHTDLVLKKWTGGVRWLAAAVPLLVLAALVVLAFGSGALRDPGPGPAAQRPYSLARVQIALWTALVALAVIWHYLATGQLTAIPDSVAALMGLSTFTLGAATVIDAGKARSVASAATLTPGGGSGVSAVLAAAGAPLPTVTPPARSAPGSTPAAPPISENFLLDILTDRNGVSMHRLQMVIWTAILAGVFLDAVVRRLFLPELAPGYLAITGVSSAGYALLKIPEQQA
jgi:hypothetical protein